MIRAYRIVKTRRAATAFDGKGASIGGGRWNSVGVPMVYLAESPALAAMEMLVHLDDSGLVAAYSIIPVEFPQSCLQVIGDTDCSALPANWAQNPSPIECKQAGDSWISSGRSLVLRVPSAVVPHGENFLLNPMHPDFKQLHIEAAESFAFDARLLEKLSTGVSPK